MGAAEWSAVAAVGSAVSASIALLSLFISVRATQTQSKVGEFNNAVAIQRELSEAQRKILGREPGSPEWIFELRELYNFLELFSLLINQGKITTVASTFTTKFIIEILAWTETSDQLKSLIAESVTSPETFTELLAFRQKHRDEIAHLITKYQDKSST